MTEREFVEDGAATGAVLRGVKALGVGLAIDDFGMGYSSLGYLRRLPVDTLKIDRSFVSGVGSEAQDRAIVIAITGLGHALGMTMTAEGSRRRSNWRMSGASVVSAARGTISGDPGTPLSSQPSWRSHPLAKIAASG